MIWMGWGIFAPSDPHRFWAALQERDIRRRQLPVWPERRFGSNPDLRSPDRGERHCRVGDQQAGVSVLRRPSRGRRERRLHAGLAATPSRRRAARGMVAPEVLMPADKAARPVALVAA